jgi:preprotein translocase subunit SecE
VQESRAELRKVTWPSRQDATNLTVAVIGMTVAIALFLGLIDAGLDKLVSILLGTG